LPLVRYELWKEHFKKNLAATYFSNSSLESHCRFEQ
jgi:hypothetical protein